MKKAVFIISLALAVAFALGTDTAQSQPSRNGNGYGMGPGMMGGSGYDSYGMGPGMMDGDGSGYGMGRGYGRQSQDTGKPMDAKEAEAMMNDYIKSTRNPNLKLGKVKEVGGAFEAEILTQKNDLVDRVLIDKETGSVRSAY